MRFHGRDKKHLVSIIMVLLDDSRLAGDPKIWVPAHTKWRGHVVDLLQDWYPNGVGVEIGVKQGEFSKLLLEGWSCRTLHLVDPWAPQGDYDEVKMNKEMWSNYRFAMDAVLPHKDRVVVHRQRSDVAHAHIPDNLDFAYIDGNHSYEAVKLDIELYYPKLRKGGLLMGDDYHPKAIQTLNFGGDDMVFGVKKAVDEFAHKEKLLVNTSYHGDWFMKASSDTLTPCMQWLLVKT